MRMQKKSLSSMLIFALLLAGCAVGCAANGEIRSTEQNVPTTAVKRGNVQLEVHTTGALRALHTAMLTAPPIGGGNLQIVQLLKTGTPVKPGDVVVAFDPSEQEYNLAQNRSDYNQAEQVITKAKDDAAVQTAQDQTALLKAKFAVRQAELNVSKNELVSAIDAQKNLLALAEAKRALAQLQQDIQSHSASNEATIAVAMEKANKARLAMQQAEQNIANMQLKSPMKGIVVRRENENASGGLFFEGMKLPELQDGDQVNPGSVVADVVDTGAMEIVAQLKETDRANVKVGDAVDVQIDAMPGALLHGTVKNIAGMAGDDFFDESAGHSVDMTIDLDKPQGELRPGFTAHLTVLGANLANAIYVPREAIFQKGGKPTVYVKSGSGFVPREVKIRYFCEGLAVIEGLKEGTEVAAVNPETNPSGSAKPANAGALGGGNP